jgi:hypothetical protein
MKRSTRCADVASKFRKNPNHRRTWHLVAMALVATLFSTPLFADCPGGQSCFVGIQGAEYQVQGPCTYSVFYTNQSACTVLSFSICVGTCPNNYTPPPPPPPPPLCIRGAIDCQTPDNIVQDPVGAVAEQPLEQEARQHIAALRGVPDDKLNVYWSRGEIRAYMYLRILQIANSTSATSAEGAAVDYYTRVMNQERQDVANNALALYNTWLSSPCSFQVPVGDPNSYLNKSATADACLLRSITPGCLLGACNPPPPSASEFTDWAVGSHLQGEINAWGASLVVGPYVGFTLAQAEPAAAFEYDSSFAGVAEGMAYLTAKHSLIGNVPASSVESDLQEQWLDGLHDFAGEQLRDAVVTAVSTIFKGGLSGGSEATLAETFGLEESVIAFEETAGGFLAESWDTFVGPAVAAAAVIAFKTWQAIQDAEVPVQLQAAIDDAKHNQTITEFAQSADGRFLILESLLKSTMPDFLVARLGDGAFGTPPSAGPVAPSDPLFTQGNSATPLSSFAVLDWAGTGSFVSVANGWFVLQASGSNLRYSSSLPYKTSNFEQWRAWLDGPNFLAVRQSVQVGQAHVFDPGNFCPTLLVGAGTPVLLGLVCLRINPSGSFSIKKNDDIVIDGQIRTAAGDQFHDADGFDYVQTTEPFGDPAPPDGLLTVVVQPDGNCFSGSLLGSRVTGPDCMSGASLSTTQGIVTMVLSLATPTVSVTGGTFVFNGNQETGSGFAYGAGGTSDILSPAVTFTYGGVGNTFYGVTATAPTDAGLYIVRASFAGNASYKPAFATAALIIKKATATITFNAGTLAQVYDGNLKTVATTTNPAGLSNVQLSFTGTPLNAGSYPVTATLNNLDYQGSASDTLVISKANPTVTFTGAPAIAASGTTFVVSASTNATTVAQITATGACTVLANTVTMISNTGTCQLNAAWATDTNYLAASATQHTATTGSEIISLVTTIGNFQLSPGGATTSFTKQLQQVSTDVQVGNGQACSDLSLFVSHVKAQTGKQLTAAQAQQLLAGAAQIAVVLGCN